MSKRMEEALRKIMDARDYHADNAYYPLPPNGPDHATQCFDDWAADLASEALSPWPTRPEDMWLIDSGTGRIQSWDCEGNTRSGDDAHACALVRQALTQDKWTHKCFDRAEALKALELEGSIRWDLPHRECGHSACGQHFIDTGDSTCLNPKENSDA